MNDSLLFCKANPIEWCNMLHLLETYDRAFGHMLNKDKTSIFFSKNTPSAMRQMSAQISRVQATGSMEKYLGLPALIGRSNIKAFQRLIDRTWKRISI